MSWKPLDLSKVENNKTEFKALPASDYEVVCTDYEIKETKRGDGEYLSITLEVTKGFGQGRKIWTNFNLKNPNPKAVEIGMSQLKAYLTACAFKTPDKLDSPDQLLGLKCVAKVKLTNDPTYGEKNEVHYFKPVGSFEELPGKVDLGLTDVPF